MTTPLPSQRIAKIIAKYGLCSRRTAERWIEERRIAVDGKVITTPAIFIDDPQRITVDGHPLPNQDQARLWCYYKPKGLLTTHFDPEGRPTVFDHLPLDRRHIISVGRLDLFSEGLLLLTNNGNFAHHLEHPSNQWRRAYHVRIKGRVTSEILQSLKHGIRIEGFFYQGIEATLIRREGFSYWVNFILTEGKNREIRRIVAHLGWKVIRLIRHSYGPFTLGTLRPGDIKEVPVPFAF